MEDQKVYESRLRRMALRQRLRVVKHRGKDPHAADYGTYEIRDAFGKTIYAGQKFGYGLTLKQVEDCLLNNQYDPLIHSWDGPTYITR